VDLGARERTGRQGWHVLHTAATMTGMGATVEHEMTFWHERGEAGAREEGWRGVVARQRSRADGFRLRVR
jgi:hypothetical protein